MPEKILDWWDDLNNRNKIGCLGFGIFIVGVLFWIPFTRAAILWLLPLGSGCDDLIFIGGVLVGGILIAIRLFLGKKRSKHF